MHKSDSERNFLFIFAFMLFSNKDNKKKKNSRNATKIADKIG